MATIARFESQKAFSDAIGMTESRISKALNPKYISDRRLAPIERAIYELTKGNSEGKESAEARRGAGRDHPNSISLALDAEGEARMVAIALASVKGSAGEGEEPFQHEIEHYVAYDRTQLKRDTGLDPAKMVLIPVSGNSMQPTLRPGDRVLVYQYQGEPLVDGSIYVFRRQHYGVIVKRVFWQQDGTLLLKGDNRREPHNFNITPGEEHEWKVIGRVLRVEKVL